MIPAIWKLRYFEIRLLMIGVLLAGFGCKSKSSPGSEPAPANPTPGQKDTGKTEPQKPDPIATDFCRLDSKNLRKFEGDYSTVRVLQAAECLNIKKKTKCQDKEAYLQKCLNAYGV